jgi:hypothetical protein
MEGPMNKLFEVHEYLSTHKPTIDVGVYYSYNSKKKIATCECGVFYIMMPDNRLFGDNEYVIARSFPRDEKDKISQVIRCNYPKYYKDWCDWLNCI